MSDESRPEAAEGTPKRKGRAKKKHTIGRVVLASSLVLALVTALSVIYFYRHLNGNITSESLDEALGSDRPEKVYKGNGEPLNILVMGSDTREGAGNSIDGEGGGGSDTTILVHLSADRSRAYAVSIPRDSIIDRPGCGDSPEAQDVMWNAAYGVGGATCTVDQLETLTDIFVDHFVVVDFNGFGDMVDAVGGVPVCVPEDLNDPEHGIFVPAGDPSVLTGDEALDYVRARSVGEKIQQNDISRIKRQQTFIAALVREVKSAGTLTRLDKVVNFLNAATKSLHTDDELDNVTRIGRIAMQLQNIGLDNVKFVTLPTDYYPSDHPEFSGRLFWTDEAVRLWRLLNEDKVLPPGLLDGSISAQPPSTSSEQPTDDGPSDTDPPESPASETTTSEADANGTETDDPTASAPESATESATESETESETAGEGTAGAGAAPPEPQEQVPGVCA